MKEKDIHKMIAGYLKLQYPQVIFRTDFAAGIKLTMGQAVRHKALQHGRAFPDITIFHPAEKPVLFLELKRSKDEVYTANGKLRSLQHIQEQQQMLDELNSRGYDARFAFGFDHAKEIIDTWIK